VTFVTSNIGDNTASVLLGNGTFQAKQSFGTGSRPYGVAVADVNGDGLKDVVTADCGNDTASVLRHHDDRNSDSERAASDSGRKSCHAGPDRRLPGHRESGFSEHRHGP
jgi:FG-GAP-like repeat